MYFVSLRFVIRVQVYIVKMSGKKVYILAKDIDSQRKFEIKGKNISA